MNIKDIMSNIANDDGTFSENKIEQLEQLSGKTREELFSIYEKESNPIPEGKPSTWTRETKLNFINENGQDAFKKLVDERK